MTKNGVVCAPSKVFWCTDSFPQVYRSIGHKNMEKMKKYRFFSQHLQAWVRLRSPKIGSKSPILMIFVCLKVFWDMPTCFQMFVDVFEPIKGVKNGLEQKTSFFSPNPLLKTAISWFDFCRYKPLTFWWFQCIFLTSWVTKMGKPLVPVVPAHFSHLGHPKPAQSQRIG